MSRFSLWCDFIENSFLDNDFVDFLNTNKFNGATSNPAIFKQAILNSPVYKGKIAKFKTSKLSTKQIYEALAIEDIQKAADKLAPKFACGNDGFISLEIDPRLFDDTTRSLGEAKRLYTAIGRPNVMMKIPATKASYEVMYELMSVGINVNATLIFSPLQAQKCFETLNAGLVKFREQNFSAKGGVKTPQAVISIFVSRFDRLLNQKALEHDKIGILNANLAYNLITRNNEPNIRALFASTGVKGDNLPKDYYIKELVFENAINTAPLDAIKAFWAKSSEFKLKQPLSNSELYTRLNSIISQNEREKAFESLLDDGLNQFCIAFEEILEAL